MLMRAAKTTNTKATGRTGPGPGGQRAAGAGGPARGRRSRATGGVAALLALALGTALTACGGDDEPGGRTTASPTGAQTPAPARTETVDLGSVRFTVAVPEGGTLTARTAAPDSRACPGPSAMLDLDGDVRVVFGSWATTCPPDPREPGNGRHGVYRTVADIPADAPARETVGTALGEAVIFDQEYYECTNSCTRWMESVAVVTLAPGPATDPARPALVVRAGKGEAGRAALARLLRSGLSAANAPGAPGTEGPAPAVPTASSSSPAAA